jgi:DNA-binding CsgD family transcriptional regulator
MVLVACVSRESNSPELRIAMLVMVATSAAVTLIETVPSLAGLRGPLLVADLAQAGALVLVTGGPYSPLVPYLAVAPITAAWETATVMALALTFAAACFVFAGVVVGAQGGLPEAITEVTLLALTPAFVLGKVKRHQIPEQLDFPLSEQERSILERLAEGKTYKEIAALDARSPESVKVSISRIYRRLGARSRDEAIRRARMQSTLGTPKVSIRPDIADVGPGASSQTDG